MWIKNFFNELKAWRIVNKVYKKNKVDFDNIGLKKDWFGRLYCVINRDTDIALGDEMDEALLHKELAEISLHLLLLGILTDSMSPSNPSFL